jgi:hypothetical protein
MLDDLKITMLNHPSEKDWYDTKVRCLVTIGKDVLKEPDFEWKCRLLKSRHSPIRHLPFSFRLEKIPYWVACELRTHKVGVECYIKSQRDDRTHNSIPRGQKPQESPVDMIWDMNAESLITICEKRLCRQATPEAREVMNRITELVLEHNPEFTGVLKPLCVKWGYCQEMYPCNKKPE